MQEPSPLFRRLDHLRKTPGQAKPASPSHVQVLAGKLRLVLLKGPLGGCLVTGDFDPAKLDETLAEFCPK